MGFDKNYITCLECGAKNNYKITKRMQKFEGKGYSFEMKVKIPRCKKCGSYVYVEEIEEEIIEKAHKKIKEFEVKIC